MKEWGNLFRHWKDKRKSFFTLTHFFMAELLKAVFEKYYNIKATKRSLLLFFMFGGISFLLVIV